MAGNENSSCGPAIMAAATNQADSRLRFYSKPPAIMASGGAIEIQFRDQNYSLRLRITFQPSD